MFDDRLAINFMPSFHFAELVFKLNCGVLPMVFMSLILNIDFFTAGGDFNAKHPFWGSRTINPKGRELIKCIQAKNLLHVSTGEPTYWPSDTKKFPDVIDFCVCKGIPSAIISSKSCLDLSSDH